MTARYSPDDHYVGTHLQVFSVGGQFVKELVAFGKRIRGAYWLHSDWLVYGINDKIIFEKFVP